MRYLYTRVYYGLRNYLQNRRGWFRLAQTLRAYVILGPLRHAFIRYHQKFSNNQPIRTDNSLVFPNLEVEKVVKAIDDVGYAKVGDLPAEDVIQILRYCENTKRSDYWNPHNDCEIVDKISRNRTIVAIARKYLGAEPILWVTRLKWSSPSSDKLLKLSPSRERKPDPYTANDFHYDTHDFKSLTAFVYLTDVNPDSGPHMIVTGSHRNKTLKDLSRICIDDDTAEKIYGNRIKMVLGKKGLVFLEDTSSYHKAAACNTGTRLLLSVDYVLRRKVPPQKAGSPPIQRRN